MKNTEKIYEYSYGLWVDAIFYAVAAENTGGQVIQILELFFEVLQRYLDDGLIIFLKPGAPTNMSYEAMLDNVWNEEPSVIVDYIRSIIPHGVVEVDDLNIFWYTDCPMVGWIEPETGKIITS